jgi:calcineurin-like phosphoesterase family protein
MKFYISDLHIGHENILQYDNRPFKNTDEMHKQIIIRWNRVVKPTDEVYILGDFAWKNAIGDEVLSQLCGRKFLILGNHDRPTNLMQNCFEWIKEYAVIQDEQTQVVLCHYPIANWYNQYRFAVHLYGHVHNNKDAKLFQEYLNLLRENNVPAAAYNVGCMMPYMDYTPRTILEIMKSNLIKKE